LRYTEGGVLRRPGHTEAAVDLMTLAGLRPAGVICELAKDDGSMMKYADLAAFADQHRLEFITIEDLIAHLETRRARAAG
jgi:3,4-dihydroxy-2-butanone 4-phosphate synthase